MSGIPPTARIDLIEDHALTRMFTIERLKTSAGPRARVRGFATVEEWRAVGDPGDLVLLDLDLGEGGGVQGSAAIESLVRSGQQVLVVSALHSAEALEQAQAAGARGYVSKDTASIDDLIRAVVVVLAGEDYVDPQLLAKIGAAARKRLTQRQQEVLRLEALGRTIDQIARGLSPPLTIQGVRRHIEVIVSIYPNYAKQADRVRLAIQLGLVSPWEVYCPPGRLAPS
jgi:DNA-binding NarL/FixJ family response regulator